MDEVENRSTNWVNTLLQIIDCVKDGEDLGKMGWPNSTSAMSDRVITQNF